MGALENIITGVKELPELAKELYKDLPQKSIQKIGNALGTVTDLLTIWQYPLNFYNEKVKMTYQRNIDDYAKKLEAVPENNICEVHPQIGVPLMEKLSYTTNEEIADLFTTLLTNASNTKRISEAHPAFVQMIERLSPDEARIVKYLQGKMQICYCNFDAYNIDASKGYLRIVSHATTIGNDVTLNYENNINVYLSNLTSMGILEDKVGIHRVNNEAYDKIKIAHNYEQLCQDFSPPSFKELKENKSFYEITPFGQLFISACTKL